jgi:two-component system NtrC family sensor kinase
LIDEVCNEQVKHLEAAKVTLKRDLAPDLPVVQADASQLRQVLINLTGNAVDAMPDGGELTVRTTNLPEQDSIRIDVSDTGCGIAEENLPRLFEPFFTTKPPGSGTGLGLSIVYGIVKMHRGQISVQSRVGAGSTFSITLPVRTRSHDGGAEAGEGIVGVEGA